MDAAFLQQSSALIVVSHISQKQILKANWKVVIQSFVSWIFWMIWKRLFSSPKSLVTVLDMKIPSRSHQCSQS